MSSRPSLHNHLCPPAPPTCVGQTHMPVHAVTAACAAPLSLQRVPVRNTAACGIQHKATDMVA
eukprot:153047-Chlamydomonas_euryale.AAC.8